MTIRLLSARLALLFIPAALPAQHPFVVDRTVPLDAEESLVEVLGGVERRAVSFRSPNGGRATGFLYRAPQTGRAPLVLFGHGAPGGAGGFVTTTNAVAIALQGAVVYVMDAPFARREGGPILFTAQDSVEQVQLAVDWQRALDLLTAMPGVDSTRIGYVGNSYGAAQGALLVGIEARIRAAVLRVGDGGLLGHFTDPCEPSTGVASIEGCLKWSIPEEDLAVEARDRWVAAMRPIEPIRFIGQSRAAILFQQARNDEAVSTARAKHLHAAAPEGSTVVWYESGHRLPAEALIDGIRFLAPHLGLRAPDAALTRWLEARRPRS